ncbi:uncharacterized oxidoreductase [[Candida] jaroonii]|uniref:Uncharacterized oxidoreductase n=1 Tax=[Candida] jaroonii TaxID=467808 RepID=A0ACA9YE74_9ASCO|nr:uncharacterized oxidoreductase [[Candida] jaroonii]
MVKSYLITGANRGIGLGLVKEILQTETNQVFATVRNLDNVADLKAIESDRLHIVKCDISSEDSIDECFEQINKLTKSIDIAILSAALMGGVSEGPMELTDSRESWNDFKNNAMQFFGVNALSQIYLANKVIPLIEASNEKKLIFVSTGLASLDYTRRAKFAGKIPYSFSKAALSLLDAKYGAQLKHKGVTVLAVCPGMVNSRNFPQEQVEIIFGPFIEMAQKFNPDFEGVMSSEEACKKFLKAIEFYGVFHSGQFLSSNGSATDF